KLRVGNLTFQFCLSILMFAKALVVANATEQTEGAPEDEHVVEEFGIDIDGQSAPIVRFRVIEWKVAEDVYKQHLLSKADDHTCGKKDKDYLENGCALNLGTEEVPEQLAQSTPKQNLIPH